MLLLILALHLLGWVSWAATRLRGGCLTGQELLMLLKQLEHAKRHLYFLFDLEFEAFGVADHLAELFKNLLAFFLPLNFLLRGHSDVGSDEHGDYPSTVKVNHL